ncbi:serine/threonine protein phosphatase [Tissierella creatinini]|nr:serine/threonine protein phosphatase [Tissierella creatinini]TJX61955.1 serine/threonine protein phosphatase [Soehngenia saccharolytica]
MLTEKRLDQAYRDGRVEYFDNDSKFIIFSDVHRGNGSHFDEFSKNQNIYKYALDYYYENGYTYIEAGDGDELWETPRFKDIRNAHFHVFESIKKFNDANRLIMIYGNHNVYLKDMNYVKNNYYCTYSEYREMSYDFLNGMEPVESLILKNKDTGQEILVVHGHQGDFANDQIWFPTMLSLKFFWRYLHSLGIMNPASPVKNNFKRHKIERNFCKWIEKNKIMLVCGHTHRFKFPREGELPYFNTGCCIYPTIITGIEISEGCVQIVRWKTVVTDHGYHKVDRMVLRGPERIEKYDISNKEIESSCY